MASLTNRADKTIGKIFGGRIAKPASEGDDTGLAPKRAFKKSIMRQARKIRERNRARNGN